MKFLKEKKVKGLAKLNKTTKSLLAGLFSILLTSCSSIPLSTMMKFAGFNEQDVIELNPSDVRIKLDLHGGQNYLKLEDTKFEVDTNTSKGPITHHFALKLVEESRIAAESHWYGDTPEMIVYEMAMTEESKSQFVKMQMRLKGDHAEFNQISVAVATGVNAESKADSESTSKLVFSVYVRLEESKDYIVLFDEAEIDFSMNKKG